MFGYFRRLKNSFAAMFVGLLMIPGSIALHAWNEYRTVKRARGIEEAAEEVQSIADPNLLQTELDQRLVHVSGLADTEEVLRDDKFPVRERAIHLARRPQMYQWDETEKRDSENNRTDFEYRRVWSNSPIDSSKFRESAGHSNPDMPIRQQRWTADKVDVGVYQLSEELIDMIDNWRPVDIPEEAIRESFPAEEVEKMVFRNNEVFIGQERTPNPDQPIVGDIRVGFEAVDPGDVSFVAQLRGISFGEYRTSNGESIYKLYLGTLSAADVMEQLRIENKIMAWALRFIGLAICVMGFAMTLRPLSAAVSFLPFLGDITSGILFVVAMILAAVVSLTTIGIAWVAVRPLLGGSLLAIAAIGGYLVYRMQRGRGREAVEPPVVDATVIT